MVEPFFQQIIMISIRQKAIHFERLNPRSVMVLQKSINTFPLKHVECWHRKVLLNLLHFNKIQIWYSNVALDSCSSILKNRTKFMCRVGWPYGLLQLYKQILIKFHIVNCAPLYFESLEWKNAFPAPTLPKPSALEIIIRPCSCVWRYSRFILTFLNLFSYAQFVQFWDEHTHKYKAHKTVNGSPK